jgi:hypothetical protein
MTGLRTDLFQSPKVERNEVELNSSRQQETSRYTPGGQYAIVGRPVPGLVGRCRPTEAVEWDHGLARGAPFVTLILIPLLSPKGRRMDKTQR